MSPDDLLRAERDFLRDWLVLVLTASHLRHGKPPGEAKAWANGIVNLELTKARKAAEEADRG